jgi:ion channel-forming bestrophin family protein
MLLNKRIPISYILNKIKYELVYILFINLIIFLFTFFFQHLLPDLPLAIPAFMGTSISILLSFKLNQAYDRWWEARKIWGSIVNDSRSLVLQFQSLISVGNEAIVKRIALRQIAWCYSLGQTLRGHNPTDNIENFISADELKEISEHNNKPLALLQQHEFDLAKLRTENQVDPYARIQIESTIVRLCDAMGRAERIKSTVFPVTYRLFLHFMIYLFAITLDISLINTVWYFEIPLLLILSGTFFLLEKSARNMQDPFSDHPTDTAMISIARTIEINLKQLIKDPQIPIPYSTDKFFLK